MWTMEDVLSELNEREEGENVKVRNNGLPPGFRFHPTDEELITFYLASKVFYNHNITTTVTIAEVDLNRCEPWDLPERAKMGEKEWYLYSLRDRKYPTGLRTNRATSSGYWKATGKDRQVHAASSIGGATGVTGDRPGMLIGMKKTLVFYQGRAPRGVKTRWVMHEYRLDGHFSSFRFSSKEEWVICRIFHKNGGEKKTTFNPQSPSLSPYLRCLPPLLDVSTTSSSSSTNQSLHNSFNNNNNNNKPHTTNNSNNNNYHSNFLLQSLLTNPLPNFSSLTDHHDPTILFSDPVSASMIVTGSSSLFGKHSKRSHANTCEMDDNDNDDDVTIGFDMSSSVAALDRLLNPNNNNNNHVNFSAESWSAFHP